MLRTDRLTVAFGGVTALSDVSIAIRPGEILSIIGPNGAGKTTLFNAITGIYTPSSGSVLFRDADITGRKPHDVARLGIARSFQNLRPFPEMTVTENVMVAREMHMSAGLLDTVLRSRRFRDDEAAQLARVREIVAFAGLERRSGTLACNLTYGEQKLLEIARCLALEPAVLLLDEPAAGMNATETSFVMQLVRTIRDTGITVALIEHDMKMVMGLSERIYVLDYGQLIAEGSPDEIRRDPAVIEAYLGSGALA